MRFFAALTAFMITLPVIAGTLSTDPATPHIPPSPVKTDAPPPPTIAEDTSTIQAEPEIRIIQKGEDKIEEYRLNGQLYMIKIIPAIGIPYYLVDEEGNGQMKQIDPNRRLTIPHWVLLRF